MKIGVDTESLHLWFQNGRMNIFQFIDVAKDIGFDGVMINVLTKKGQQEGLGALGKDSPEHIRRVGEYLKKKKMFVELAARGTKPEYLKKMVEVAHLIGAKVLRTYVVYPGSAEAGKFSGEFHPEYFLQAIGEIKKVIPVLEKYRIGLAVENHELETCDEIRRMVSEISHPLVGVHYDLGNTMMAWEEPLEGLDKILPWLMSTHMKDHVVCRDGDKYVIAGVPMGQGNIDIHSACWRIAGQRRLDHLIIENCYPYASEFRRPVGSGGVANVGKGAFAVGEFPWKKYDVRPLESYLYEGEHLEAMMEQQMAGLKESYHCLKKILSQIACEEVEEIQIG